MTEKHSYRYERKFAHTELDEAQIRSILIRNRGMFFEVYPKRYVNNIYLDTPWLEEYDGNVCGGAERKKVRVRWYHALLGPIEDPILEFKFKHGLVGWKDQYPFPPFNFDTSFTQQGFKALYKLGHFPPTIREQLEWYLPTMVNRYCRSYFATVDEKFRVTIDTDLIFYKVNALNNQFRVRDVDSRLIVVEMKYNREFEPLAERISRSFPFRLTRSSKYTDGIERFYEFQTGV